MPNADETRAVVRARYAQAATGGGEELTVIQQGCCSPSPTPAPGGCCGTPAPTAGSCCGGGSAEADVAKLIGYSEADLTAAPSGANLGLGCGNPGAIAGLKPGETVLDLGSGAGFDCFLAARQVREAGRVIGVDMTPEMLAKARQNAAAGGYANVEFRLGEIEHLPVADQSVDVIISNCVINLSPEKPQVFAEAFRVLKPGGRLAVSDMVTTVDLPPDVRANIDLYCDCIAGAASVHELEAMLQAAGFGQIRITRKDGAKLLQTWGTDNRLAGMICPAFVEAIRP